MATSIKISQLPAKGANLEATDLLEVSEFNGTGYVSKSITGQEIIDAVAGGGVTDVTASAPLASSGGSTPDISIPQADAGSDGYLSSTDFISFTNKQEALVSGTNIKTINGSSVLGSGDLTITATANPSVIVLNATDGTAVTGTTAETISRSLLIPANTFTTGGMLEILGRINKTGTLGAQSFRIYKNTSNSLTGATLIGLCLSANTATFAQAIRTFRINSNTITGISTSIAVQSDYSSTSNPEVSTTFNTSIDNYILLAITLVSVSDSSVIRMARATKYI